MRTAPEMVLTAEQAQALTQGSRAHTASVRLARRAKIVLWAASGKDNTQIARELGVGRVQVGRWRERYRREGRAGIAPDLPRGGRNPTVDAREVVRRTTQTLPDHATHWSTRTLAKVVGVGATTIGRVWRSHGLKPHLIKTFKVSRDPQCVEQLEDVVGLYVSPPEHALVLCGDEKSQGQALDRTQPGLPLQKGRAATMPHDYKRHGTTTLLAALTVLDGKVSAQCQQRQRHSEGLRFLRQIDRETSQDQAWHLICDHSATHKHPKVLTWRARHPRITMPCTPTSASWLNMVERFFRDISEQRLRRGVFPSVPELISAIEAYVDHHNKNPKAFIWTAKANDILQKVLRANHRLSSKQNGALH